MGCTKAKNVSEPTKLNLQQQSTEGLTLSKENINLHYRFDKLLGSGNFGTVKLAFSRLDKSKPYAIKTIPKVSLMAYIWFQRINQKLDHPNIIRFYESYQDTKYVHFVMEFCSGGELFEKIISKGTFSEMEAAQVMEKLFNVITYLHRKGVAHRDLKPENLLLSDKSPEAEIKLIDFGLSNKYDDSQNQLSTKVGTPLYVAPEVLEGKYGTECDNWSLGVIMYVLLCGTPPFFGETPVEVFHQIKKGQVKFNEKIWKEISNEAKQLIKSLLTVDAKKRKTSAEALKHDWFKHQLNTNVIESLTSKDTGMVIQLLKEYSNAKRLKKEALKIILNQMKSKEIQVLHDQFKQFDIEKNGVISLQEMKQVLHNLGYENTENEITDVIKNLRPDSKDASDLHINYSEFIAATLDKRLYLDHQKLWNIFQYFDTDSSGEITLNNLRDVMARGGRELPEQELQLIMGEAGENGKINFDQFCKLMKDEDLNESDIIKNE